MIRAVIFDMYETLVTLFGSPHYFGEQIARDAKIPVQEFRELWDATEEGRSIGTYSLEDALQMTLVKKQCYSKELLDTLVHKRLESKREAFLHIDSEIIPMLKGLKKRGVQVGLISNCFSEEVIAIRDRFRQQNVFI